MMLATCLVLICRYRPRPVYGGSCAPRICCRADPGLRQRFLVCLIWLFSATASPSANGGGLNAFVGDSRRRSWPGGLHLRRRHFSNGVVFRNWSMSFPDDLRHDHAGADRWSIRRAHEVLCAVLFMILWVTFIYFPMAHMVWVLGWTRLSSPKPRGRLRCCRSGGQDGGRGQACEVTADAGLLPLGCLDFAGGTVVHINAGIAGLVLCLFLVSASATGAISWRRTR